MNRVIKLIVITEGEINIFIINTYLKMKIPIFWRKFFMHIANKKDYIYNVCNNPDNKSHEYCREWYLYNLMKRT